MFRNVLTTELFASVDDFIVGCGLVSTFGSLYNRNVWMTMYTYGRFLDVLCNVLSNTLKQQLQVDFVFITKVSERHDMTYDIWISREEHPTNDLTRPESHC